jgi:hypothetical protein
MDHEPVHRFEPDMIGIDVVGLGPPQGLNRSIGGGAGTAGLGPNNLVFAVGLVPDRNNVGALAGSHNTCLELRPGLVGETIPYANRKFFEFQHLDHKFTSNNKNLSRFYLSKAE